MLRQGTWCILILRHFIAESHESVPEVTPKLASPSCSSLCMHPQCGACSRFLSHCILKSLRGTL